MISICIPIYNFDVRPLVKELSEQITLQKEEFFEIILIDDASDKSFREKNLELNNICQYIQLEQNVGRSKIRNLFLKYTTQSYLLFLDCDGIIDDNLHFISNYLKAAQQNLDVVCGGRVYTENCPSDAVSLNWKYGKEVESPAIVRSFMSNNFMNKRSVLEQVKFDESLTTYGHEDTLFGIDLKRKNIQVSIINNPVLNNHLEENEIYLEKNISSIKNLISLIHFNKITSEDFNSIRLLKSAHQLEKFCLDKIFLSLYNLLQPFILSNLKGDNPNLTYFSLFKLGEFLAQKKESTKL